MQPPTLYRLTNRATFWRATRALQLLALVVALSQITACGGGSEDDDQPMPTPAVDCKAHPELCK